MTTQPQRSFEGFTLVITGAGRGIGRGYALAFAGRRANVVVNDVDAAPAHAVVEEIVSAGGSGLAAVGDVADPEVARTIVSQTVSRFGSLDGVIINASIKPAGKEFAKLADPDFEAMLSVNVFGAMLGLMRTLALEGARVGVRVNAIAPGAATRMTEATLADPGVLQLMLDRQPPELVAPLAVALMSEQCSATGEIYHSGGGHAARSFIAETRGVTLPPAEFTAENILARWDELQEETGYRVPHNVSESGDRTLNAEILERLKELGFVK